jgi:hypothetical protein
MGKASARPPTRSALWWKATPRPIRTVKTQTGIVSGSWQPDGMDLNEVRDGGQADFTAYDLDDSATAAGEFVASFEAVSIRPTGHPYAA